MRRKILLLAALLAVVGGFGVAPRSAMGGFGAAPRSANAVLTCPAHPPGFCCSGPPLCRCTRGPCL
jgi:hypothetical protein